MGKLALLLQEVGALLRQHFGLRLQALLVVRLGRRKQWGGERLRQLDLGLAVGTGDLGVCVLGHGARLADSAIAPATEKSALLLGLHKPL